MKKETKRLLIGKRLYLRPIELGDINKTYLGWMHDGDVTRYLESRFNKPEIKDLIEFYEKIKKSNRDYMFSIIAKGTDAHIGNIKLGGINYNHKYADLGIMIGDKRYWNRGYGQEASKILLRYAFRSLKLDKVILGVYGDHKGAIKAYKKVGFKIEGRIRDLYRLGRARTDKVIMGISRKEFKG